MVLMKVSTKIIVGYSLLILLMGGAVAYQVLLIHRVQRISSELSSVNFQAAAYSPAPGREPARGRRNYSASTSSWVIPITVISSKPPKRSSKAISSR